jgi:hypothetical protein
MALKRYDGNGDGTVSDVTADMVRDMKAAELAEELGWPRMARYSDGAAPRKSEPHSEHIAVECETLSDGSFVYNVLFNQPDGLRLRIGCLNEKHAWDFADALSDVSVTVLADAPSVLGK